MPHKPHEPIYVVVQGNATNLDDKDVPGVYLVEVDPSLSGEEKAEVALDHFHEKNGIAMLEDFDIAVFDASGTELPRMEAYDNGSLQRRGEYCGGLNDVDVPASVKAAMNGGRSPAP